MQRNATIVTTLAPVQIDSWLAASIDSTGKLVEWLEFTRDEDLVARRPLTRPGDVVSAHGLFTAPRHLHLYGQEMEDGSVRAMLMVEIPREGVTEPWLPSWAFHAPQTEKDAPRFFPLGPVEIEACLRPDRDFIREMKALLIAVAGTEVSDATERSVQTLIESAAAHQAGR
jgi:hypothetical protein